jgi:4-amino-4-deoxy-L-arabinose transferase-like glycosyltransferase
MRLQWTGLASVLAIAFALRVVAAVAVQYQLDNVWKRQFVIEGDANGYWDLAGRILNGQSFEIYTPPRQVLRMPGFPALLAATRSVFGDWMLGTRLALCAVGTAACWLVYGLGRRLMSERIGLIAAFVAAVSPVLVGFTPLVLSETLFAACLVGSLIAIGGVGTRCGLTRTSSTAVDGRATGSASDRSAPCTVAGAIASLLAGALIGVACYVRPSWLLAAPVYAAVLMLLSHFRVVAVVYGALLIAGALVVLMPWGLRNQRVTGHFVLTTLWAGPSLYDGLNPEATGDSNMTFYDRDNLMGAHGLSEHQVDRHYRRAAWEYARAHPRRALQLALIKLGRFWSPVPNADQFGAWPVRAAVAVSFVPMLLFGLIGGWKLRSDLWTISLTAGPILYFTALHMVFVSSLRYRLPAEYPLLVLSAAGVEAVWMKWRSKRRKDSADSVRG